MKNLLVIILVGLASMANAADWPREVPSSLGLITIYQPQLSSYTGNYLKARAAISITRIDTSEPIFGAIWLDCRVATDRPNRTVKLEDVSVRQLRFPSGTDQDTAKIADVLEAEIPRWELTFSLDELLESMETAQKEKENARGLDLTPPKIILRDHPAVLVLIDGEPMINDVEGIPLKRVINTPYFLVQDPSTRMFYLKGGALWYFSMEVTGPWRHTDAPPGRVVELDRQTNTTNDEAGGETGTPEIIPTADRIPEIVVSEEPAELIATDGPIAFTPINGTGLLYASNTPSRVFLEIATQHYFILASGRWFTASALAGPWSYVASNQLPADFANIPPGSECDDVLAQVSGTLPAKEAIFDSQIPQTAEVDRNGTTSDVQYDGDPQFEPIENTEMEYALNSSTPVIHFRDRYYDCDKAVWFEGPGAFGPWTVCISVPQELYTIPPRYPVYYVRYVRVYSYTPTVVYTGYTAGYTGCYVYNGTVIYGTGYHYRPWYRHRYFPRPWTWGFGIHYDPWAGWSMGYSHGWWRPRGWFANDAEDGRAGWWGPNGYRPLYRPETGPMYRKGYHPVYRPVTWSAPVPQSNAGHTRTFGGTQRGTLYDRWATGVRRPVVRQSAPPAKSTAKLVPKTNPPPDPNQNKELPGRRDARRDIVPITKPEERPANEPKVPQEGKADDRGVRQPIAPIAKPEERPATNPNAPQVGKADDRGTRQQVVPIAKPEERPGREPDARPLPKQDDRAIQQNNAVKQLPPVPQPAPKANNVFADPTGNILRKTQQTWEVRTNNTWQNTSTPPPSSGVERDSQVRERAAERSSGFKAPPPPPPPPPAPAPKPQPAPPQRPAEKKSR